MDLCQIYCIWVNFRQRGWDPLKSSLRIIFRPTSYVDDFPDQYFRQFLHNYKIFNVTFSWKNVSADEPVSLLTVTKFNPFRSPDFYGISNYLLKNTVQVIAQSLSVLINNIFLKGVFLSVLRLTRVTPIFEKGDKTLPVNYRTISNVDIFSKLIESVMKCQL